MNNFYLILGIVFLIGIGFVFYKYNHRRSLIANIGQMKDVIKTIFDEAEKETISQNRLIKGLKQHLGVNEKQALNMVAAAKKEGLVKAIADGLQLGD